MPPDLIRPSTSGVSLRALAELSGAAGPVPDLRVTGASLDSRTVLPGDLYAALPGFNVHGAQFSADAVRLGAVAVLTDAAGAAVIRGQAGSADSAGAPHAAHSAHSAHSAAPPGTEVPLLVVDDPRARLGQLAAAIYGDPGADLTMVGITGTNGKTTTAYLLESALRALGCSTGLIGTIETRVGKERLDSSHTTPEATDVHALLAVMRERGADTCVMEVSSHALDQHRVDGVVYDVALFTNLSQDHLDYHGSMEDYFAAKARLFTPERSLSGVVCVDDEWGRRLIDRATVPVTTLTTLPTPTSEPTPTSTGAEVDWSVVPRRGAAVDGASGQPFHLVHRSGDRSLSLASHLPGDFNVANTAIAAVALLSLGHEPARVEAALAVPPSVPGRMEVVAPGGTTDPRCIVDFAHTPDAIDVALAALRPSTRGRLIAVLGAGGDRDRGKREAMGRAAARHADIVVVTDDNPRSEDPAEIRRTVLAGARSAVTDGSAVAREIIDGGARSRAISSAIAMALRGSSGSDGADTVVVLGKGHEKGQEVNGVKHPFDDREAVRTALRAAERTIR
ncbi:UDP-N-acetylmuramoyl-L-alanyl-D-glutamate--2,6-diaminopimelate ligase [Intrasporangium calvum]|uniref:UDP-N-acetylmuramoyl-L-alanyl-D-glutamate--2,6-diaminopimelate ligase n=1 Tax=Intrasporangium calvum (strain ATCC 23552 / DSM 43043 / JCM 3097 / NBRC 12989 / NCIMB 10167 / NRRL B-3866 / 7 KIP) TaxID=710696 RepID=E6S8A7_INTC7|nr:UDP-N-acetylmuramoyl-L-alanyl-D-glutamate--2,6-diaminopimelate ligase [Intrasporangium calvum]ADU48028.1 UDP-N-acetylmuramoylalanyl-D-glutamate--2,6-diaminopimelate ligase [Intrasporangium calvum DSM 43043]